MIKKEKEPMPNPNPNKLSERLETISEKLRAMPLLRALVPLAGGIVTGSVVAGPLYVWVVAAAVCASTAVIARRRQHTLHNRIASLHVGLAILFFGAALARAHTPRESVPRGERVWMEITLDDAPVLRPGRRSASTGGTVTGWRTAEGDWQRARERMTVSIDTVWGIGFGPGERVLFSGYVNPLADSAGAETGYTRLMRARGYTGRTHISQYSRPSMRGTRAASPTHWAARLRSAATERLHRLGDSDAIAVAAAMTTGDRGGVTPAIRENYSRTGASHLLAVSGLHVGIVFLVVNALLWLLPLFRGGHIVKNIVALAAIWFYAALTGLSPSATRAAFMFSGAQVALAASRSRNPANIMCGTAIVMLAVRPGLLFDISFQLSFVAVAAIMAWFGPIYGALRSRYAILNALWSSLILGVVASVATMPLVSHTFGVFSPAGVVLNPLVVSTAWITICFSLIWIAAPAGWLAPVFRWLVGGPAWLQNRVTELAAAVDGVTVEWTMPLWMVVVLYAAMVVFTMWFQSSKKNVSLYRKF
jgi:competence protein ComEC